MTEIELVCEMDEQWSFVGNKQNQRWLWYAWSPHFKRVFAYALGRRTDAVLEQLLALLKPFNFSLYCTDDWGAYSRLLPKDKHLIAKKYTQSIDKILISEHTSNGWLDELFVSQSRLNCTIRSLENISIDTFFNLCET